ncbi:MAG: hypothetical protein ABEJ36_02955 [Candidatus Nanosalina sp.]
MGLTVEITARKVLKAFYVTLFVVSISLNGYMAYNWVESPDYFHKVNGETKRVSEAKHYELMYKECVSSREKLSQQLIDIKKELNSTRRGLNQCKEALDGSIKD